jgi:glycosyltransferase involved in cell wall biosynthesis
MKVGIDAQLARGTATGIGEYVTGLIAALRAAGTVEVVPLQAERLDPWRFDRRVLWDQILLPRAAAHACVELLHCASGTLPLFCSVPAIATVHDVAFLRVQGHVRAYARAYFGAFQLARYRAAQRIVVDSRFSRDELLACGGIDAARVDVVYPGVAPDLFALERTPDEAPFALAVGTVEVRKNLAVAIEALRAAPGLRLVSVGPFTPYREECLRVAREAGVLERVEFRGYVSRSVLLDLYARATCAVVPSRYEGFGYAAAQALCAGLPLLAADAASLPEVAGEAANLPPADAAAWGEALRALLAARESAEAAAAARRPAAIERFAWRSSAAAIAAVYARALMEK